MLRGGCSCKSPGNAGAAPKGLGPHCIDLCGKLSELGSSSEVVLVKKLESLLMLLMIMLVGLLLVGLGMSLLSLGGLILGGLILMIFVVRGEVG